MDRAAGAKPPVPRQSLKSPYGVASDSKGQIYVADAAQRTVFVFDLGQKRVERRGNRPPARLAMPIGLAIDDHDRLYVSDAALHQITCFRPDGEVLAVFGVNDLQRPAGIAVDNHRHRLYVTDAKTNKLAVFDTDRFNLLAQIGGTSTPQKAEPGRFSSPSNVAVGADGIMVEAHPNPRKALSDGPQSLDLAGLRRLVVELQPVAASIGRSLA